MTKDNLKSLISEQGLTILGFVEAFIEINNLHGVSILALGDMIMGFCQNKLKRKSKRSKARKKSGDWILTDPDTEQYGKQLSKNCFVFKEKDSTEEKIDISSFTLGQIEDTINAYGYTLLSSESGNTNIADLYGDESSWIIAECIFEMNKN